MSVFAHKHVNICLSREPYGDVLGHAEVLEDTITAGNVIYNPLKGLF